MTITRGLTILNTKVLLGSVTLTIILVISFYYLYINQNKKDAIEVIQQKYENPTLLDYSRLQGKEWSFLVEHRNGCTRVWIDPLRQEVNSAIDYGIAYCEDRGN